MYLFKLLNQVIKKLIFCFVRFFRGKSENNGYVWYSFDSPDYELFNKFSLISKFRIKCSVKFHINSFQFQFISIHFNSYISSSSSSRNCRSLARGTTPQRLSHDSSIDDKYLKAVMGRKKIEERKSLKENQSCQKLTACFQ